MDADYKAADAAAKVAYEAADAAEAATARAAEQANADAISAEAATARAAEGTITTYIEDVEAAMILADSNEAAARLAADASEKLDREAAIAALQADVDGNEADADAAIATEKSRAEAAESALGVRVDNMLSNLDPAALDSFTEMATAFAQADSDLSVAVNTTLAALQADVDKNEQDADDAEKANADAISSEAKVARAAEKILTEGLAAQAAKQVADDAAMDEELQAVAEGLQTGLDAEIKRASSEEKALNEAVANLLSNSDASAVDSIAESIVATNAALKFQSTNFMTRKEVEVSEGALTFPREITPETEQIFVNGLLMKAGEDYIADEKTPGFEFIFLNEALELVNLGARVIAHAVEARLGVIEGGTVESEERLDSKTAGEGDFIAREGKV